MATMRKISGKYYARFYDRARSPQRKTYPLATKRQDVARRRLAELEEGYRNGDFDPWKGGWLVESLSFEQAATRFLEEKKHLRPKSQKAYRVALKTLNLPPGINLTDVARDHLVHYVRDDDSVTVATRRKRYRHLRTFFNWAKKQGHIEASPLDDLDPPKAEKKQPEFLTPAQFERLLRAIDADFEMKADEGHASEGQLLWLKDLVTLAVNTGFRLGELTALRWRDVDFDSGLLHVRNSEDFRTKSGNERAVPMTRDARSVLERLDRAREEKASDAYVLLGQRGGKLNGSYASKRFKHYIRLAKLPERIKFHSLRHTCASWLVQRGVSLPIVQGILGHSNISVTERYAHLAPDAMRQAMQMAFDR
jgi:integrase